METKLTPQLAKSLSAAMADLKNPEKSANNPHFKSRFAPLDQCLAVARPVLAKHGLALSQVVDGDILRTMLFTEDGGVLASAYPIKPVKADPQGVGSAITYARRYALLSILAIAGTDEDDDAQEASIPAPQRHREDSRHGPQVKIGRRPPNTHGDMDAFSDENDDEPDHAPEESVADIFKDCAAAICLSRPEDGKTIATVLWKNTKDVGILANVRTMLHGAVADGLTRDELGTVLVGVVNTLHESPGSFADLLDSGISAALARIAST